SEVVGRIHHATGQDKNITICERVPLPLRIAIRPLAPKVECAFRRKDRISGTQERRHKPVAPPRKRRLVDREILKIRNRVLHHGIRKTPTEGHLGGKHNTPKSMPTRKWHQGRYSEIPEPLSGCE